MKLPTQCPTATKAPGQQRDLPAGSLCLHHNSHSIHLADFATSADAGRPGGGGTIDRARDNDAVGLLRSESHMIM